MVDDEARRNGRPGRGRASWTGAHRSGASRPGMSRVVPAREPPPPEPDDDGHSWLGRGAGPVVLPYTLTGGRARPITGGLGLLTYVEALYAPEAELVNLQPEHRAILSITRTALSVAEIAARIDLPVGVVRV